MNINTIFFVIIISLFSSYVVRNTSFPYFCPNVSKSNQVVFVSGASSGIGRELAFEFARKGASLVLAARRRKELEETAERCRSEFKSSKVIVYVRDLASKQASKDIAELVVQHFDGNLDIAVLNHAVVPMKLLVESRNLDDDFFSVMDINLASSVRLSASLLPFLEKRNGKLIGIGSAGEYVPSIGLGAYQVSKVALSSYFDHLRMERTYLGSKVTVQYVVLGKVDTDQLLKKYGNVSSSNVDFPPPLSEQECVRQLMCVIDRGIIHSFVPSSTFWYTIVGSIREILPWTSKIAWVSTKPDLEQRIVKAQNELLTSRGV